jgi:excinuclease ABC subunit A
MTQQTAMPDLVEDGHITVSGARVHNLKNIDVSIPRNQLVVLTGLSGSGKSSLAFDTIHAEGQRRYMESFSAYARQFMGNMERPDVDKIDGLSPVISIEQKTVSRNPRSTVGTITEIYDFLRLLYARAAEAYSYVSGNKMVRFSEDQIKDLLFEKYINEKIFILAPLVRARKGHYRELFEQLRKQGYQKVRVDSEVVELRPKMQLDRYKIHDIEVVIDRVEISEKSKTRLSQSLQTAMKAGKGIIAVLHEQNNEFSYYSRFLMDADSGLSYDEPQPNSFSFNSPYGHCPKCNGIGTISEVNIKHIIPNPTVSINKGGLAPLGEIKENWTFQQIRAIAKAYKFSLADPIEKIPETGLNILLYGSDEKFNLKYTYASGATQTYNSSFEGIIPMLERQFHEKSNDSLYKWAEEYMQESSCPECNGARLKKESLFFKLADKNIAELSEMSVFDLAEFLSNIETKLNERQNIIAFEILKEIRSRLQFLIDVGLGYLSLNSPSKILSGGEAQRIRLATQIGSQLVGVLYILDEPSIGLHQRDNTKLIQSLKNLRDLGNSVIVVEHDKEMIEEADYILDIGPGAGIHGGKIVAHGTFAEVMKSNSSTAQYLSGKKSIAIPESRRKGNDKQLVLKGCSGNNLKNINVTFPLGTFICVTGVSGGGKSSLINETLYPILNAHIYYAKKKPLPYKSIDGLSHIDKVIEIDQSPIGRTPRSNPATYTGVFDDIRKLFAELPDSKIRGFKPGRFSFNVKGGRCETCKGGGLKLIEMNFLPDVYVQCEDCRGKRYNRETLEVRYRGKSIYDVLNMDMEHALLFFENMPQIHRKIKAMYDVGLGYITLGQSSVTLSGGEAQRVKLSSELSKKDTGNTVYILDEPTTGLHFEDVHVLLNVLHALVDKGNTVIVIEHNMDVIKTADYIIDIGPEGGNAGGEIVAAGSPESIAKNKKSYTGFYLKKELQTK